MIFKTIGDGENTKVVTALQARRIAQEQLNAAIAKEEAQLQADIICLKNYEAECLKGNISTEQFKIIMSGASDSAKKFAVETKGAAGSTEVFVAKQKAVQSELKATTTAAKGTGIAMKALSVVGNMIVFTLIAKGIQLAATAIDNYIHRAEKCKERVEEMISAFDSAIDTANSHKKTIDEIGSRYEELSKGVNSLGENISLTSDEYSEYNDIVNQIAEMFPSMVQGYTSEGNAILTLKGNVDALTDAYEAEAQAAYNALIATGQDSDGNDIIADWKYSLSEDKGKGTNITQAIKELETFMTSDIDAEMYTALRDSASAGMYDGMTDAEKMIAGSEFLPFKIKFDLDDNGIITDEELAKAKESAKVLLQTYNAEIESDFDNVKTLANAYLMTNEDFKKLDEQSQSAASLLLNSIPATSDIAQVLMTGTKEEVGSYVNFIVQALSSDNPEVKEALINLLTLDTQDLSPDEIQSMINGYISTIAQYLHRDENELKIQLGFEDVDSVAEKYNNAISQFGESGKELLSRFFKNNSINSTEEIDYWTSVTKGATDATDAINKYNRAKELTIETPNISNTEILAQIQSLSEGLDQLDKIYADVLDKEDFDWSSILNNDGFIKAFGDMQNVTDEYKSAYDDFINTITNNSNDISACQSAFDDLATAYIYNSGALDNLTIETKDATIAMLEQMGVENAKEFVESQLAITTSEIKAAQEQLGIATESLTDLTAEQIIQLLNEGDMSEYAKKQLYALYLSQLDLNNNPLDTSKSIQNLLNIVGASSEAGKALVELGKIMAQIANMQQYLSTASGDTSLVEATLSGLEKRAEKIRSDATASFTSSVNVKSKYTGGSKTNSAKTNSAKNKSGSSSSKDTVKTFDLVEIYINRISRSIDKLNKKVSNTWNSWSKRNKALKQELNKVLELQTAQEKAAKYYKKKANKITLSSNKKKDAKLKEQLRNGAIDIKTVNDEKLAEKMQQYLDYWDKVKEYTDAAADSFEQYQSLVLQKFEQIQAKYDARIGYQENRKSAVQDALDLSEAKGQEIGSAYYTKQKGINDKEIKKYKNEEKELIKAMADVPKYSEQWYKMKDAISQVKSNYVQLEIENANLQKSINDLKFDRFDDLIDKLDDVVDETNFLIDMLDSDNLFDKNGMITDDGITAMGLTAQNYDTYLAKAERYKSQIAELEAMYNNGDGTIGYEEYQAKLREYQQGQRSAIQSANEAKKAVIDYVREGLEKQNQVLEEAVSKQKELLKSEQDLYNFQRKIADQNKNIADLRKQLNALEGDSSEEARKRKQQLKAELADAEQEQKDTLYDRSISDQEKALDEMLENSQKQAEDYLSNSEKVLVDALNYVNTHSYQVSQNLEKISKDTGYSISENISNAWKGAGNAVDTYESILSGNVPKITMQIDAIIAKWNEAAKAAEAAAKASASASAGKDESAGDNGSSDNSSPKLTKVREYIASHVNEASKKQNYYGSLNQYIYDRTGGKVLSVKEQVQLAKMLGVSVKDDLSGKNDRDNILRALKNVGWGTTLRKLQLAKFATGGTIGKAINQSGEDGFILARTGEEVLSIEKIKELGKSFQMINPVLDNLKTMIPTNQIVPRQQPMEVHIDNSVTVEGVATDQIVKDFEKVAQKQAENTISKINSLGFAKGVRRK